MKRTIYPENISRRQAEVAVTSPYEIAEESDKSLLRRLRVSVQKVTNRGKSHGGKMAFKRENTLDKSI